MQMRDEMSMLRYRSNNAFACPMVIGPRLAAICAAARRITANPEKASSRTVRAFASCFPSNARDAAGLLRTAIRCDDPVLFLEHKHLYRQTYNKGEYPGPDYMIPFGKAAVRRDGSNVVVFTWGALVQRSLLAAQQAEKDGISVMVVDLRTIAPFDWDAIAAAVKHTNRVVIAHEDQLTCGFGAELAARIVDQLFEHLDAPVRRVAALDTPVAYAPVLEEVILPQSVARPESHPGSRPLLIVTVSARRIMSGCRTDTSQAFLLAVLLTAPVALEVEERRATGSLARTSCRRVRRDGRLSVSRRPASI